MQGVVIDSISAQRSLTFSATTRPTVALCDDTSRDARQIKVKGIAVIVSKPEYVSNLNFRLESTPSISSGYGCLRHETIFAVAYGSENG